MFFVNVLKNFNFSWLTGNEIIEEFVHSTDGTILILKTKEDGSGQNFDTGGTRKGKVLNYTLYNNKHN